MASWLKIIINFLGFIPWVPCGWIMSMPSSCSIKWHQTCDPEYPRQCLRRQSAWAQISSPKLFYRYGCLNVNEWKLGKLKMQFMALATFQVFSRHLCRGLGWGWAWDRRQRTFYQCRKFWSQRGPGEKASLLLTHRLTACPSLHCSSTLHVTCPNVRLSSLQVRKTLESQSRTLNPLTAQHSQAVKTRERGILIRLPTQWSIENKSNYSECEVKSSLL